MSHSLTTVTPLSPTDTTLLTLYLTEVNTHLPAFANKNGLGIIAAIAFLARPDIASYIAHFHRLRESTPGAMTIRLCGSRALHTQPIKHDYAQSGMVVAPGIVVAPGLLATSACNDRQCQQHQACATWRWHRSVAQVVDSKSIGW